MFSGIILHLSTMLTRYGSMDDLLVQSGGCGFLYLTQSPAQRWPRKWRPYISLQWRQLWMQVDLAVLEATEATEAIEVMIVVAATRRRRTVKAVLLLMPNLCRGGGVIPISLSIAGPRLSVWFWRRRRRR